MESTISYDSRLAYAHTYTLFSSIFIENHQKPFHYQNRSSRMRELLFQYDPLLNLGILQTQTLQKPFRNYRTYAISMKPIPWCQLKKGQGGKFGRKKRKRGNLGSRLNHFTEARNILPNKISLDLSKNFLDFPLLLFC